MEGRGDEERDGKKSERGMGMHDSKLRKHDINNRPMMELHTMQARTRECQQAKEVRRDENASHHSIRDSLRETVLPLTTAFKARPTTAKVCRPSWASRFGAPGERVRHPSSSTDTAFR